MRTVNEMAWEQRCAADAEARDWAREYGRGEFYYSQKWGQLTAVADGTTTLTDVADALAAGTATPYQEALAASYWVGAADYLAVCALGAVAQQRRGRPPEGLADDRGEVPRLVDDDALAAAQQRKTAADAALAAARQIQDAAVDREHDQRRWEEAENDEAYHEAGDKAAAQVATAQAWRTAAAITYREHFMDYGNDGRPEDDRHLSDSEVAARAAAITTIADATGVSEGYVFAELGDAAVAEGSAPGSDNDPDYLAPPNWETFVDRYQTGLPPGDSDELMGWADDPPDPAVIATDPAEGQRVYDHLTSDPYYAGPEGNGTQDSSTVYEHLEVSDDEATGRTAAQLRGEAADAPGQPYAEGLRLNTQMLLEQARLEVDAGIDIGRVTDADALLAEMTDAIAGSTPAHELAASGDPAAVSSREGVENAAWSIAHAVGDREPDDGAYDLAREALAGKCSLDWVNSVVAMVAEGAGQPDSEQAKDSYLDHVHQHAQTPSIRDSGEEIPRPGRPVKDLHAGESLGNSGVTYRVRSIDRAGPDGTQIRYTGLDGGLPHGSYTCDADTPVAPDPDPGGDITRGAARPEPVMGGELAAAAVAEAHERYAEYDGGDRDELARLGQAVMTAEDALNHSRTSPERRAGVPPVSEWGPVLDRAGAALTELEQQRAAAAEQASATSDAEVPRKAGAAEVVCTAHAAVQADIQRAAEELASQQQTAHASGRAQLSDAAEQASTMQRGA